MAFHAKKRNITIFSYAIINAKTFKLSLMLVRVELYTHFIQVSLIWALFQSHVCSVKQFKSNVAFLSNFSSNSIYLLPALFGTHIYIYQGHKHYSIWHLSEFKGDIWHIFFFDKKCNGVGFFLATV